MRLPLCVALIGVLAGLMLPASALAGCAAPAAVARHDSTAGDAPSATLRVRLDEGPVLLSLPLSREPRWEIRWNHSVTGILVSDFYFFDGERMLLTASHAPAFDAGLGHIPGRGRTETDGAHGYWILDIDEPVPGNAYALRVGSLRVDHRLVHDGVSYSLSELAAGRRVIVEVVR